VHTAVGPNAPLNILTVKFWQGNLKKRKELRPRGTWEGNNKIGLKGIGWEDIDWISVAEGRDQQWGSCGHSNEQLSYY
jgi:hypothetical protein